MMRVKGGVTVKRLRSPDFVRSLKRGADAGVYVGIPADKDKTRSPAEGNHSPDAASRAQGITNAEIGLIMEHGAPEVNIPARPSLVPAIRNMKDKVNKYLRASLKARAQGDEDRAEKILHALGIDAVSAVQAKITSGPFVALKKATLAARRRIGIMGTKPLIATGQFRRAITYVIRKRS